MKTNERLLARLKEGDGLLSRLARRVAKASAGPGPFRTSADVLDHYVDEMPSAQNAIDSVPGWVGAMPPHTGLIAGKAPLYADSRLHHLLHHQFSVAGKSVLELGPLEGFHTSMLHEAGAAAIDAIEANTLAFVRCLITKEILKLHRASFFLGDFMKWMERTEKRYDLIVASGVLYHSHDPVHLLETIAAKTDSIFLWTHYFDDAAMPMGDLRRVPFSEQVEVRRRHGIDIRLHERSYYKAWRDPSFCGGIQDRHFWIDRADIIGLLTVFGFDRIEIADEQPEHVNGPSFSIFAQRSDAVRRAEEAASADAHPAPVADGETGLLAAEAGAIVEAPPVAAHEPASERVHAPDAPPETGSDAPDAALDLDKDPTVAADGG